MKRIRLISLLSVIVIALSLLGACGNESASKSESDNKKVELQIATWANEKEAKEFDEIINKLNKESDNYELKQLVIPQDYYTKIQTMIAGNTAPDLMWLAQEYIPAYAENGAVMDITNQLNNQDEIDMSDYFDGSLDTAKWEGKTYGLPWIGQPYVVYYNKTLFEKNNVDEPKENWTWDAFHEIAKKLTKDGVYGFANTGSLPSAVLAWGEGGDLVSKDGKPAANAPATVKGLEKYYEISSDKSSTMPYEEANSLGVEQGFVNGEIAMMVGGANDDVEKKVKEAGGNFEVGMAVMPAGSKEQKTFNWTASTLVSSQTKNKDVAFEALVDITNAMFDWKVPAPVRSKADKIAEINPYKEYALDIIKKSMDISRGFNNLPQQNELGGKQWETLDSPIITNNNGKGNLDVQKVADETQEAFESILGK
ncbi:ABC transporter substrate-binding protein [Virgibacillus pantothenticus]|uniref:ABC transporter substrate-binding protein n=1 Tax=Virgibacillus pantothenticus TaxID=1473 RepID=UPI0009876314|nr:sugar ABC transporter substrate-binding protein [Virgibacillus pantothenticus]